MVDSMNEKRVRDKLLIADDYEVNRTLLREILGDTYDILEAEDGEQAMAVLREQHADITVLLLDIVMPKMNGYEVLECMKHEELLDDIPVIMISAESDVSYVERAFRMGVTDYINRPFGATTVKKRVDNVVMLFAKQEKLIHLVEDEVYKREYSSNMIIEVLSNMLEFRGGESGLHIMRIGIITEILLKRLTEKTKRYNITYSDIEKISAAAALHDIGKVSIPEEILNKPGSLTEEEFEIIKTHPVRGAEMLQNIQARDDELLLQVAHDICRWHHEKFDGSGYPDGLKGDGIPISAQAVSLADAYEVLISKRVYKEAYSHEVALQMIACGACGVFNPMLVECLIEGEQEIIHELDMSSLEYYSRKVVKRITQEIVRKNKIN